MSHQLIILTGAGGTEATEIGEFIEASFDFNLFILRKHLTETLTPNAESELSYRLTSYFKKNEPIPNELIIQLFPSSTDKLNQIIIGFPRTLNQLQLITQKFNQEIKEILFIVLENDQYLNAIEAKDMLFLQQIPKSQWQITVKEFLMNNGCYLKQH